MRFHWRVNGSTDESVACLRSCVMPLMYFFIFLKDLTFRYGSSAADSFSSAGKKTRPPPKTGNSWERLFPYMLVYVAWKDQSLSYYSLLVWAVGMTVWTASHALIHPQPVMAAWSCQRFPPYKIEFFLSTVIKCLLRESFDCWSFFYIIVQSLPYNIKPLKVAVVMIWLYIKNWIKCYLLDDCSKMTQIKPTLQICLIGPVQQKVPSRHQSATENCNARNNKADV